ncbi:MAG: MBL fold metallo-hydrolase, partial [Phycisphaeraceae bacterium]|nr:MBL fold metallo-hydrolase [Phycisphaeraceae bacterium]
ALLAGPVGLGADALAGLARFGANLPGAGWVLPAPAPDIWAPIMAALLTVVALGGFRRRARFGTALVTLMAGWLLLAMPGGPTARADFGRWISPSPSTRVQWTALPVGNGSCHLIRGFSRDHRPVTLLIDAGAGGWSDVGNRLIAPALARAGVQRIDAVVITHADLDHFLGLPALIDDVTVDRLWAPPALLAEAAAEPDSAIATTVAAIERHGSRVEPIIAGWRRRLGPLRLRAHWPPSGYPTSEGNEGSIVLQVDAAERRFLFTGDAGRPTLTLLMDRQMVPPADVVTLSHHGAWPTGPVARRWLDHLQPNHVIQSSTPPEPHDDPWPAVLVPRGIPRWITGRDGQITVSAASGRRLQVTAYRRPGH